MNRIICLFFVFVIFSTITVNLFSQGVAISTSELQPDESAILDIISTEHGLLLPRMTTVQRDNISDPAESLLIFNTNTKCFETYVAENWHALWCPEGEIPEPFGCEGVTPPTFDGYTYSIVGIGEQCWFAENLRTTVFNDNSPIPFIAYDENWGVSTPAYSIYYDGLNYVDTYGYLYNHYAVREETLCPVGWKVPSDDDWRILAGFVDQVYDYSSNEWQGWGEVGEDAGQRLKSTSGWSELNGTDDFGFNGKPGGQRSTIAPYGSEHFGDRAYFWTSNGVNSSILWRLNQNSHKLWRDAMNNSRGNSIRCIKDF